jgi:hypothetical protein
MIATRLNRGALFQWFINDITWQRALGPVTKFSNKL